MIGTISFIAALLPALFAVYPQAHLARNPDSALFIRAQRQFYTGRPAAARKTFVRLSRRFPGSIHHVLAVFREADCAWEIGRRDQAARAYRKALKLPADARVDRAVAFGRLVAYHMARHEQLKALDALIELRVRFPTHPLADWLPAGLPEPVLTFAQSLRLARSLRRARRFERALEVLDQVREPAGASGRYRLADLSGRILFEMQNRYQDAFELLSAARDHAPSEAAAEADWFLASRALGRLDKDEQAVASHLAMVARYPRGKHAARALFYAAWLQANRGRCDLARPLFGRLQREYPASRWLPDGRWFEALCDIKEHKWRRAQAALAVERLRSEPGRGARALYWTGVARAGLGRATAARAAWKATIKRFPLGWYSLLARSRLGDESLPLRRPPAVRRPRPVADELLDKAKELADAGLGTLAALLLRREEHSFLARHPGDRGLVALLDAYRAAGDFNRPWLLVAGYRRSYLRHLPSRATRPFWDHSYPDCERRALVEHSRGDPAFALFLQAVMRTESGFDPQALSPANARGLLQMIPAEARRAAAALKIEFDEQRLFEPDYNIRLAARAIWRLRRRLAGRWPLVAGAYNGGEDAMTRWLRKRGDQSLDLFVESVPWTETRRYMKRVTTAFARYSYLEGRPLPRLSLNLDSARRPQDSGH